MSKRGRGVLRALAPGIAIAAIGAFAVGPAAWTALADETATGSAAPDLTLETLSNAPGPLSPGDVITYAITVTDAGAADAHDVVVTAELPAGVALAEAPAECALAAGTVTCPLGTIAAGARITIELTVVIDTTTCGEVAAVASVSASDEPLDNVDDANGDRVTDSVTCPTPSAADLVLDTTSDATAALPRGDGIVYTLTVTNVGATTATGIHVHDDVPPGLQITGALPTMHGGACSAIATVDSDGNEYYAIDCRRGSLAPGASATGLIRMRVDAAARCGRLVNTAFVTAANEPKALRDARNHARVTDRVVCEPSIALEVGGPFAAHVGDAVTDTLRVSNDGERGLVNIHASDAWCGGAVRRTKAGNGDRTLARGESWAYTCTHTIETTDGDPARLSATVTATDGDGHRVRVTGRRSLDVLHPGIAVVLTPSTALGRPGSAITFTYAVTNTGDTPLLDVRIADDTIGDVGRIASIEPGERRIVATTDSLPAEAGVVRNVGAASGRDALGVTVTGFDDAVVTVLASTGRPGQHGGGAFTGADTVRPAALAGTLLVLGIAAIAAARKARGGSTETEPTRPLP
jgi:uncharacterized repeat protein (TIGR01451 family)